MLETQADPPPRARPADYPLFVPLIGAALAITLADCVLLQRRYLIFTGGFKIPDGFGAVDGLAFVLLSLVVDAAWILPLLVATAWLVRRWRWMTPPRLAFATAFTAVVTVETFNFLRFEIARYFGDRIEFTALKRLAGGSTLEMLIQARSHALVVAVLVAGAAVTFALGGVVVGRLPRSWWPIFRFGSSTPTRAVALAVVGPLLSPLPVMVAELADPNLAGKLRHKTTVRWSWQIGGPMTDFDGDGYGLVGRHRDFAPFDATRHPFAVDWPGNGVDENNLAGDLSSVASRPEDAFEPVEFRHTPDFVLVMLESFRADNLEAEIDGRPVAPVLRRLASRGVGIRAWSHAGSTSRSRRQLLQGSIWRRGDSSILDDFHANGYRTVAVSGADEQFGDMGDSSGLADADVFIDARDDVDERSQPFSTPGSLHVPWQVVVRNVEATLQRLSADDRPIVLIVNLVDAHFPYHNYRTEPLIHDDPIPRSEIAPENADWLKATYRNTSANVDRAVGRIMDAVREHRGGEIGYLVVGDHGEALFDDGLLGHGTDVTATQLAAPLIVGGFGAKVVDPMALSDVRGMLRRGLRSDRRRPELETDSRRTVFLYAGRLGRPSHLGLASPSGLLRMDMVDGQVEIRGTDAPTLDPTALIHRWEELLVLQARGEESAARVTREQATALERAAEGGATGSPSSSRP